MSIIEQIKALPKGKIEVKGFGLEPCPTMTPKQAEAYQAVGWGLYPEPGLTTAQLIALAESHERLLTYVKSLDTVDKSEEGQYVAGLIEQAEKLYEKTS